MRHQPSDVALAVADSSDMVQGTVRIACRVVCSVRRGVAENDLMIFLELGERSLVAGVVAIVVRDGNFQDLAWPRGVRKGRIGLLDANVDVTTDVAQPAVAHHRAGEQARFAKNLEAVADA